MHCVYSMLRYCSSKSEPALSTNPSAIKTAKLLLQNLDIVEANLFSLLVFEDFVVHMVLSAR